ncbi:LLM class flavin-dependent oxidoreductase [Mycolicibacterium phlei]|jgi:alkanesulfonate monooxygenase SsuD/methylene tetrahydromethanopterin reductase-like flavin-dependent oxidoreductase (luciferase family)
MTSDRAAHLLLQPQPEGHQDLSWLYRATDAAERAVFDAVVAPAAGPGVPVEPTTLLANLAARTSRIGLVVTASAQYVAPYNTARVINTLDNLSSGRAGWWLVNAAEDSDPRLHPATTPEDRRWARAAEYTDVLRKLWESWAAGAVVADKESGVYVDEKRLRPINHEGEFFRVAGPLNLPRSPQLHPPLFAHVENSAEAADFARSHADVAVAHTRVPGVPLTLRIVTALPDADQLARAVAAGEVDGYVLRLTGSEVSRFAAEVLPRLRDLGVARAEYESSTLRGHLGLAAEPVGVLS